MSRGTRIATVTAALLTLVAPAAASAEPRRDPLFDQQWALARESALGRAAAWQQSTGVGALVAVLDTGADLGHPDLQGAFWTNPSEIPANGVDDDRNGFVDDVHGADLVNDDGDPSDDEGHGTHVAGIVAARAGNGAGGSGLAPGVKIMVVKVLDERRAGTAAGLAEGIRYAVAHGARILNTSVNGDGTSRALQEAIRAAGATGALVVASAGNDGRNIDARPSYPASYDDPSVIAVGATGATDGISAFSNHGTSSVDLAAPGEDVLSTASGHAYEARSGTSMSAPFVSATLALVQSVRPDLDGSGLKAALLAGARRAPQLDGTVATGALDAAATLREVLGPTDWRGGLEPLAVVARPVVPGRRGARLSWDLAGDDAAIARVRVAVNGRTVAMRSAAAPPQVRTRARPGRHAWRVEALDAAGTVLAVARGTFRVRSAKAARRSARATGRG